MLRVAIVASMLAAQLLTASEASGRPCTEYDFAVGVCPRAQNEGDRVDLLASSSSGGHAAGEDPSSQGQGGHVPRIIYDEFVPDVTCDSSDEACFRKDPAAEPADAGFPAVTLADLASFRPATPEFAGEPAGFGVVRMPTNFVAAASAQDIPGVLLGYPVTVRFTPVAYVFSYGDGQSLRTATGGVAWAASGSPQFTPTDTSHAYQERGVYLSSVATEYSAAVDFGAGWRAVDGVVTARTGDYPVQVVEARTALVERTCAEDPRGPGC